MLIYSLTVIILPVLTLGIIGPLIYARSISDLSAANTREKVEQVTANLETIIASLEKVLKMTLETPALQNFYRTGETFSDQDELEYLFRSVCVSHPEITGLMAVNDSGESFSVRLERIMRDPLFSEDWYQQVRGSSKDFDLITRPIGRNLVNTAGVGPDEIVSFIKAVRLPLTGLFQGVLLADLHLEYLEKSFDYPGQDGSSFFCILDAEGNFVYAPVNPVVYRINPEWFTDSDQIVEKTIQGRGYRFIYSPSSYTGWKTIGVYYLEEALQPVRFVLVSALFITLVTVFLTVTISMIYTNAVSKPVMELRAVMEKAGRGDLAVRYEGKNRDEIGELGNGLNLMLQEIEALLNLVYKEQKSKREAELRIMQQQIKPHFLYNTLDTILWMAEENEPAQIVKLVTALTKLFRITLSQGREVISVQNEIEHARSYLIIQKSRYEDKFEYEIECPESLRRFQVQKMILQPLVENSIYHGIKEKDGRGHIRISVELNSDTLVFTVSDNGAGIGKSTLESIRKGLSCSNHEPDGTAFALYNVNDRIRLTYGDTFGLFVESREGEGTVVKIIHPVIREEG